MDKQRKPVKCRTFGSNRWKQARGTRGDVQISCVSEKEPSSPVIMEKVLGIFQELDENKKGFLTRADMQKLEADLPWSTEELELVFDGLDSDSNGYLTIEEFTAGLRHFLSSQTATREHRKRKTASTRVPLNLSLEESDNEEQKCFQAFINQLGADYIFEDQSEIWKIWVQLRQDEPNLLGNLEEFLAKMTHLIKEAKHAKEKLQLILKTQVADHNKEVQQLYEEMEQQIEREKQRLQHESEARSQYHSMEMQEVLNVREREIQNFLAVQKELEMQFLNLKENQHMASTQNQQLKQTNIALEQQLQQTLRQLQETQKHMDAMKSRVSQIHQEGGGGGAPDDMTSGTKADLSESRTRVISIEEDPLAGSFLEQQYFLPESSGQNSLFKELSDAIAALVKVPGPQKQQSNNLGFQEQKSLPQTRQNENLQQSILQEEMTECGALLRNVQKISETLTCQTKSQDVFLQEGKALTQTRTLEMIKTKSFESREVGTPEPVQRGSLAPEIQSPKYSEMAKQVNVFKKVPVEGNILVLEQVIQPEHHMHALQCRDTIQVHGLPADSEKEMGRETSPEIKTPDTQHSPVKDVPPAHFPARIVLPKLRAEFKPESALLANSQLENVSKIEGQVQTMEGFEVSLTEDRGAETMSKFQKNQEVSAETAEETNVKPDAQENATAKESSEGTTDVCYHPDHLYNVLFVGDSNVGKTAFLHRLHNNSFGSNMSATIGMDYRIKNFFVDNKCFALQLWDTAGQERYHSVTKQFFRKADGVVLMYDITSEYSFANMRYWLSCIQEGAGDGVIILPLGNKTDCIAERRVSTEDGEYLAKEYALPFYECSAASGHNVLESMVTLVRSVWTGWRLREVLPEALPCCRAAPLQRPRPRRHLLPKAEPGGPWLGCTLEAREGLRAAAGDRLSRAEKRRRRRSSRSGGDAAVAKVRR
ncbi:ras-related protein Rab-44 [Tiliqua scincoides]|uniref:ras-related protein Rab-44 n=1 Tax=Tiliqua scincoides TaxID=71010 RepID=UPI0034624DDF